MGSWTCKHCGKEHEDSCAPYVHVDGFSKGGDDVTAPDNLTPSDPKNVSSGQEGGDWAEAKASDFCQRWTTPDWPDEQVALMEEEFLAALRDAEERGKEFMQSLCDDLVAAVKDARAAIAQARQDALIDCLGRLRKQHIDAVTGWLAAQVVAKMTLEDNKQ